MTGQKKWQACASLLKSFLTSLITRSWDFVLLTSVWAGTINSSWWRNKLFFTIQLSRLPSRTHPSGLTQCTSACLISATEISNSVPLAHTPFGKSWWTSSTGERILPLMKICRDALWLTVATTFLQEINSTISSFIILKGTLVQALQCSSIDAKNFESPLLDTIFKTVLH